MRSNPVHWLLLGIFGFSSCNHGSAGKDHIIVSKISGLGSTGPVEQWVRFDADTGILQTYEGPFVDNESPVAKQRTLGKAEAAALWQHATAVLHGPRPKAHDVSDYLQHVVIHDGGDVLDWTDGGPFEDGPPKALQEELAKLVQ